MLLAAAAEAAAVTVAAAAAAVAPAAIVAASPDAPAVLPAGHAVPSGYHAPCLTETAEASGPAQHNMHDHSSSRVYTCLAVVSLSTTAFAGHLELSVSKPVHWVKSKLAGKYSQHRKSGPDRGGSFCSRPVDLDARIPHATKLSCSCRCCEDAVSILY